ncbi:MAG TPA: AzlD domain-containing protein [Alphaproteobacteria bacterium]
MIAEAEALLAVIGMAAVTYATRAGGVWLASFMTITPRTEAFLRSLSSSVLVALVVPAIVKGDAASAAAATVALGVMIVTRSAIAAITVGIVVAAAWRHAIGFMS